MPAKKINLIGQRFGFLTVRSRDEDVRGNTRWVCVCDCGTIKTVFGTALRHGTKSCGCYRSSAMTARNLTHGMTRNADGTPNRTYRIWFHMRNRCENPKHDAFENYGGRGIEVCERWQVFENFFADMGEAPDGMSIERERNNEGYGPGNCKWATTTEQNRNKRSNIKLTYAGKTMTLKEWAVELGLIDSTLRKRIANGWSVERAFETPTR